MEGDVDDAIDLCNDPRAIFKETIIQRILLCHLYAVKGDYKNAMEVQRFLLTDDNIVSLVLVARRNLFYHLENLSYSKIVVPNE